MDRPGEFIAPVLYNIIYLFEINAIKAQVPLLTLIYKN